MHSTPMLDSKPANSKPTPSQMLDAVPTRNVKVTTEQRGRELLLKVPVKPRWFLKNPIAWLLLPQRGQRKIALDPIGREVWELCNGRNTVETISERIARNHRLRFHEARMSVMHFLQDLTLRGCVVMVVPETEPRDENSDPIPTAQSPHHASRRDVRRGEPSAMMIGGAA